jgi:hypothetical protein
MRISIHYGQNLGSLFSATTRTMFGAKAIALLPSSTATPFNSWFQWPRSVAFFVRVIAKKPFAKGILPPKEVTII